ncbi:hypothetical protein G7048_15465 [Diaphorobacter sp. HDW4B]|uniref:hypothetical protein n=1 Tax=Diaphorobacter sp. HDW4B TaxID=2714925 RepID=UPI00140C8F36|nr:hypothetical protein [Diaphorobacter sp. HDW4B]QIL71628.1 hypothetical protein G7048_15465 [Diaphorobacter sp. HDW4B]
MQKHEPIRQSFGVVPHVDGRCRADADMLKPDVKCLCFRHQDRGIALMIEPAWKPDCSASPSTTVTLYSPGAAVSMINVGIIVSALARYDPTLKLWLISNYHLLDFDNRHLVNRTHTHSC